MIKRALTYTFFGGIAAFTDIAFLTLFVEVFSIHYLLASIFSFIIATFTGYFLQRTFTFKSKSEKKAQQIAIFTATSIIGLLINTFTMYLAVSVFGLWYLFAVIIAKFIGLAWNFSVNNFVTFRI